MREHILKKDLLLAKAGKKVEFKQHDELNIPTIEFYCGIITFVNYSDGDVEKLIAEGWIEEVKPREGYVVEGTLLSEEQIKDYLITELLEVPQTSGQTDQLSVEDPTA